MKETLKSILKVVLIAFAIELILFVNANTRITKHTYKHYQPYSYTTSNVEFSNFKETCKEAVEKSEGYEVKDSYLFISDNGILIGFFYVVETTNKKYFMYNIWGTDYSHLLYDDGNFDYPASVYFRDDIFGGSIVAQY